MSSANVPNELAVVNFSDLTAVYHDETAAGEALREFSRRRRAGSDLSTLLRNHSCEPISRRREIRLRDAFDDLLAFYGLLEIAATLGYIGDLPSKVQSVAKSVLSDEDVRGYYESHYPLLLPQLFRRRASGERTVVLPAEQVDLTGFLRFLDLNSCIEADDNAEMFLAMIDDYRFGDDSLGIDDLLTCIGKPGVFAKRITRAEQDRDVLDSALHGFRLFLRFCRSLDDLLLALAPYPIQQSLLWHHHSYWFECMRDKVGGHLHAALRQFAGWDERAELPSPTNLGRERRVKSEEAQQDRSLTSMHDAINRLTSGRYGWVLRESPAT